ncbi:MAG: hypothetical protein V2B17_05410 [Chloroflexota bacterium]
MSHNRLKPGPETAHSAAEPVRGATPAQPAATPATLPAHVLGLQRQAGNAAVTSLLAGTRPVQGRGATDASVPVQRNVPPDKSVALPDNYDAMTDTEKTAVIRDLVAGNPGLVYTAWKKLASPLAVARANPDLFTSSMKIDDDIVDLSGFDALRGTFEKDVIAKAKGYLSSNKKFVQDEREKTGAPDVDESVGGQVQARADALSGKGASAETDFAVQEVQRAAAEMERIKVGKAKCLGTQVGYKLRFKGDWEFRDRVHFNPGSPPDESNDSPPTYDIVMAEWSKLIAAEAGIVRTHPSAVFFMGVGGDPSKIKADKDIRVARAEIGTALADLEGKIDKAIPLVGDDLEFTDFVPIHQQLMGGTPGGSGTIWSKPVEKAVAKETLSDANMMDLLATLGVGTLSAALFVFAELASGGLATFLFAAGAGVSGAQAAKSWDTYVDLSTANKATITPETQLVSGEQVDAAMVSAILDTVFAAIDGWQAVKGGYTALKGGKAILEGGKAGATAGAATLLKTLRGADNPAAVLAKAVAEVGLEDARKLSGLGFDDLAKIAGENTDLGKQFAMLAEKGAGAMSDATRALVDQLPKIGELSAEEGEKVLAAAAGQFGYKGVLEKAGGWGTLKAAPVMKGGSGSAAALEGWRATIVKELGQFMEEESGKMSKAVRTGTEKASSDLDVQILGGTAAELQQRAEGWLAGRMGTDVKRAKKLLDAEIFVDPTRAHLIDLMRDLGEDVRAQIQGKMATYEQQMILGARLKEAEKAGKEAVDKVMKEAGERGITPFAGFEALSPSQQKQTAALIDGWMTELKDPANASRRGELIERVSKAQANINASHPDAYVGGGVAVWVSGRDIDIGKIAEALNVDPSDLAKVTTAQRISAALSEGKWLDAAVGQLKTGAGGNIDDLTKAVRNIGKHGARAAEVLRVPGKTNVGRLEYLMDVLASYKLVEPSQLKELVTSGDLALMRGEITRILDGLSSETSAAISALQKEAGGIGVSLSEMADFQSWLKWQGRYKALTDGAAGATAAQIRAMETALEEAQQASYQEPRESREYPLPPNQSVAPPP